MSGRRHKLTDAEIADMRDAGDLVCSCGRRAVPVVLTLFGVTECQRCHRKIDVDDDDA